MIQLVVTLIAMMIADSTNGQYPDCVSCSGGSIPLSPLSYNTLRSNMFRETQPSNDGCTHEGQIIINCGQGATLIDCDQGVSVGDYSDLTSFFTWNRAESIAQQVSIEFRFGQEVSISNIRMFFWNSPSDSIIVPNNIIMQFTTYEISMINNRTDNGQNKLNIDSSNDRLLFKVLRIEMSFYNDSEWIFLSEVQFCGNTAPFHITQPSTDNDVQVVTSTTTQVNLTCSLNVTISSTVITSWLRNGTGNALPGSSHTGDTATLLITNFQPSDAGVYQCVFNDQLGSGWTVSRNIRLLVINDSLITTSSTELPITSSIDSSISSTAELPITSSTESPITSSIESPITLTTESPIMFSTVSSTMSSTMPTVASSSNNDDDSVRVAVMIGAIVGTLLLTIVIIIIIITVTIVCGRRKESRRADDKNVQLSLANLPQHNNSDKHNPISNLETTDALYIPTKVDDRFKIGCDVTITPNPSYSRVGPNSLQSGKESEYDYIQTHGEAGHDKVVTSGGVYYAVTDIAMDNVNIDPNPAYSVGQDVILEENPSYDKLQL